LGVNRVYYAAVIIGRITGTVRPSVRLSVPHGFLPRKQKRVKNEIGTDVSQNREPVCKSLVQ